MTPAPRFSWIATAVAYTTIAVPLYVFLFGFSYTTYSLLNLMPQQPAGVLPLLTERIPAFALIFTIMIFITNACIGLARVTFKSGAEASFKYASILFLLSTISLAATLVTVVGNAVLQPDIVFTFLLGGWRGRLIASICAVVSALTFCVACISLIPVLVGPARELLTNRRNIALARPAAENAQETPPILPQITPADERTSVERLKSPQDHGRSS